MENTKALSPKTIGIIEMTICGILWSVGGVLIKFIDWNPLLIAGLRSVFSGSFLFMYMKFNKIKITIYRNSLIAGLSLGLMAISFVVSNKLTTAANAIVLQYTSPIFIIILSVIIFKEKFGSLEVKVVAISIVGMILFFFDKLSLGNMLGNMVAIFSGICMASTFIFTGRKENDDSTRLSGILFANIFIVCVGFISLLILKLPPVVYPREVMSVAVMGIVQLGVPYVFYTKASKVCSALSCSLIGMLEPILNPVWVAIFAHEVPGIYAFIGAVVILSTVTIYCIKSQ